MGECVQESFKERVKCEIIRASHLYNAVFVNKEYLIYSDSFTVRPYYILTGKKDNFLHLTGVSTTLKVSDFFDKALLGALNISDFEIKSSIQKGYVRRKINVFSSAFDLFSGKPIKVEEQFIKNQISCAIASTDGKCTLGFTDTKKCVPKTLLKGNELKQELDVHAMFVKHVKDEFFNQIIYMDEDKRISIFKVLASLVQS